MSVAVPVSLALVKALFLCLDSLLMFLLAHGWLKRVEDILVGTCLSIIPVMESLKVFQRLLMSVVVSYLDVKSDTKSYNENKMHCNMEKILLFV